MARVYGVVPGTVIDVNDPQGEGRVQVRLDWLSGENDSTWAPVATFMAGDERGSWFMPEVGDEVLLSFQQGDVNHPYVVGFLWNGRDKPPVEDGATTSVRRLRTVSGHVLEFDDTGGSEHIEVKFKGEEPSLTLDANTAVLKTGGGHELKLDDSGSEITLKWQGAEPSITLAAGKLTLTMGGSSIELSAAAIAIKAPQIKLN